MVSTRDLDPDEHVYANWASDLIQQVGKALRRRLSKLLKRAKSKVRARRARRQNKHPSFVKLPPWQYRRRTPSPELCDHSCHQVSEISSHQQARPPDSSNICRRPQVNKSYESMPKINPLPRLYVTNPDPPSPAMEDGCSTKSNISITKSGGSLPPSNSFQVASCSNRLKRTNRIARPRRPLENIPKEPIPASLSAGTEISGIPMSMHGTHTQRARHMDELWFTTIPTETLRSPLVYSSSSSSQDEVFAPSTWLSPSLRVHPQSPEENSPRLSAIAPIRNLRPSRSRRLSFPPRIQSLYFRAGSPFANGNFPWDQKN